MRLAGMLDALVLLGHVTHVWNTGLVPVSPVGDWLTEDLVASH